MSIHDSPAGSLTGHDVVPSDDGSWNFMDIPASGSQTDSPSVAFLPSPASRSLASYGVVTRHGQGLRGPSSSPGHNQSPEPLPLHLPPTSSPAQTTTEQPRASFPGSVHLSNSMSIQYSDQGNPSIDATSSMGTSAFPSSQYTIANTNAAQFLQFQDAMLFDQQLQELAGFYSEGLPPAPSSLQPVFLQPQQQQPQQQTLFSIPGNLQSGADTPPWNPTSIPERPESHIFVMDGYGLDSQSPESSYASVSGNASLSQSASPRSPANNQVDVEQQPQQLQLTALQQLQLQQLQQHILQLQQAQQPSVSLPPSQQQQSQQQQTQHLQQLHQSQFPLMLSTNPVSLPLLTGQSSLGPATAETKHSPPNPISKPIPSRPAQRTSIDKVRGSGTRVTKKKASPGSSSSDKLQLSGSLDSSSSDDKFVIFTPKTISTHTGSGSRFNPFECFEAMSATQKGRKGPLAEEVKESALQVRRAGACFCCHSRKVKCDAQLPCKNCIKLATHLPQAMCWRFDDFIEPLFPSLIRNHFRKDVIAALVSDNVVSFNGDGPHTVHLSAGSHFKSTLEIRHVRIFQPTASAIVMKHARLTTADNQIQLSAENSLPLALDLSENATASATLQQEKIKKTLRVYVDSILKEDAYVETVTANLQHSDLPKKILTIARNFYFKTSSPIVKQALYIYTMQFMMMHHLTFTAQTLQDLPLAGHLFSNTPFQTSRLLNRQIKAILDELMQEEVDKLFRMFTRELKPKARMAWATCLAAFLVFCLFMETTGLSIDYYVITENQTSMDNHERLKPSHARSAAVKLSRALENLPFRQFAFQFHNIYQTHQMATNTSSSSSTPSPSSSASGSSAPIGGSTSSIKAAFNPLVDDGPLLSGDLDKHANDLVMQLRELLVGESWSELDFLAFDQLIDTVEAFPYPRDVGFNYTGRLCSKFLLSFQNQNYIFTPA